MMGSMRQVGKLFPQRSMACPVLPGKACAIGTFSLTALKYGFMVDRGALSIRKSVLSLIANLLVRAA
jgi:hypothetical protein